MTEKKYLGIYESMNEQTGTMLMADTCNPGEQFRYGFFRPFLERLGVELGGQYLMSLPEAYPLQSPKLRVKKVSIEDLSEKEREILFELRKTSRYF